MEGIHIRLALRINPVASQLCLYIFIQIPFKMQHFRPYFDFIIIYTEHSTRFFTDLFRDVFADSYSHHSFVLFVEAGFWKKKKKQNPK